MVDDQERPRLTRAKFLRSRRFNGYAILAQQGAGNPWDNGDASMVLS
jgi:hypothetical protein